MATNKNIWDERNLIERGKSYWSRSVLETGDTMKGIVNVLMSEECEGTMKTRRMGIYKILNMIDGKYYVGSTNNFSRRWNDHRKLLIDNGHYNIKLQSAWNKYGEYSFKFVIERECSDGEDLLYHEQQYLDECKRYPESNYNISYDAYAPWRNRVLSESHRNNVSKSLKGKPKSIEHNRKVGLANRGKPNGKRILEVFTFKNKNTGEIFTGIRSDFYKKFNLKPKRIDELVKNKRPSYKGWLVISANS